jgi:(E)-4-hydroxy-3-methylbut-2-enyl-diphosphate synthase
MAGFFLNPLLPGWRPDSAMSDASNKIFSYCNSVTQYKRLLTREVFLGDLPMGAQHPIRIQSMTTTDTMDTLGTVAQTIRMVDAGCEYVRITAPSLKEAQNLLEIKKELKLRGYIVPLIADIHFTPNAAELAARIVEKVRVNPGNYADKKKFENIVYTDTTYVSELERIRSRFTPLVKICKEYGTAMRIGTNHGSLSDRILSRYGDTPLGMVESALEFVRICEDLNYHNLVLSMKASNAKIMVEAYRLLVLKMLEAGMNYPLHLGVTEAGEGEDGRIKSAAGIGTLLEDGIGDTVRVSLTEDPEFEIPVAKALVKRYDTREGHATIKEVISLPYSPYEYAKRVTSAVLHIGAGNVPRVVADFNAEPISVAALEEVGYKYIPALDKWNISDMACDFIFADAIPEFELPGTLGIITSFENWNQHKDRERVYPIFTSAEYFQTPEKSEVLNFVIVDASNLNDNFIQTAKEDKTVVAVIQTSNAHGMAEQRRMFISLLENDCKVPVIIQRNYETLSEVDIQLQAATDLGALLLDGFGDGIWIKAPKNQAKKITNSTAFGILQATRTRISKTEYISCPSCGRTLFDLQETTARIRQRTDHLKGVKIGIMGCIVNGPGEMADADYGYVGVGVGKITLYRSKEVVKRSIAADLAVDALIELIKEDGKWIEKE